VLERLAAEPSLYGEVALLLVNDEEWRREPFAHGPRFDGWDACLCFEGGELTADGEDAVVVRRKAAGTIKADATGQASHSGARPEDGRNALLALAELARRTAGFNDPDGPDRLTSVPTILRSGHAFNVVPGDGELAIDLRADDSDAFEAVLEGLPGSIDGVELDARLIRVWPGMDTRERSAEPLARAAGILGRPLTGSSRGGATDASHVAPHVPLTIDGLGPLGGGAHSSSEFILASSLPSRSEVALALAAAVLAAG
jgi:glutamate carboxypeptidase